MKKTYEEEISYILDTMHSNMLELRYTGIYHADDIKYVVNFLDNCSWAVLLGGKFKDEILQIANETLQER